MSGSLRKKVHFDMKLFSQFRRLAARWGQAVRLHNFFARIMNKTALKRKIFKNYTPDEHDVLVCVYGKSGTNWMLQMVTQIAHRGQAEFEHIHDIVPWPEAPGIYRTAPLKRPTWESAPTGKRAIKTHLESDYIPYNAAARYLVCIRDPKDALLSGFHFNAGIFPGMEKMPMEDWVDMFIAGKSVYGSWSAQVASCWSWRDRPNVLVVYFEELKQDLIRHVGRVAEFMDVALDRRELELVVQKCDFSYMKTLNEKFTPPFPTLSGLPDPRMFRNGDSGGHKTEISTELCEKVDRAMREQLDALGSDFPYERYLVGGRGQNLPVRDL